MKMSALEPGRQRDRATVLGLFLTASLIVTAQSSCGVPPRLVSAELKEQFRSTVSFAHQDKVEYICRPGYIKTVSGENTLVCGADGTWYGRKDFCTPKQCPHPGEPANGRLSVAREFLFGSSVNFTCDTGYRLFGSSQITCVLKEEAVTWDRGVPSCEPIPCAPPPGIANGEHSGMNQDVYVYGDTVTYHCHTVRGGEIPLSLVGDASIFCTTTDGVNGVWSSPAPQCKVVVCEYPRVDHGKLLTRSSDYTYGVTVLFSCNFRFTMQGSETSMCKEDGSWDPPPPTCQRSSCDDPPHVANADTPNLADNLFPVDTVVTYQCRNGYQFSMGETMRRIKCLPSFTWSEIPPACERVHCSSPHIPNTKPSSRKAMEYKYGDTLEVTCDDGFVFKGRGSSITLWCRSDGTWDPAAPECIAEPHCPKPNIPHGIEIKKSKNDYTAGTQVDLDCDEGYVLRGSRSITCLADNTWDHVLPFCDRACGPAPGISNGQHSGLGVKNFPYGANVTYTCLEGLSLIGNKSIYCTSEDGENLTWSGPAPECKVVWCPKPTVQKGRMTPERFTFPYGVVMEFSCDEGFKLHGSARSQCLADGTWHPPVPTCQPVCCSRPSWVVDINAYKEGYGVNDKATFRCVSNSKRIVTTCSANGTWIPPLTCEKKEACETILRYKAVFECGIPLTELKTLLEVQKLYLEIQKLEKELRGIGRG